MKLTTLRNNLWVARDWLGKVNTVFTHIINTPHEDNVFQNKSYHTLNCGPYVPEAQGFRKHEGEWPCKPFS